MTSVLEHGTRNNYLKLFQNNAKAFFFLYVVKKGEKSNRKIHSPKFVLAHNWTYIS